MNLPNLLTCFRLLLIPLIPASYYRLGPQWALFVFMLANLTDVLDGYLARKLNKITTFGTLLDPAADKLSCLTSLITLYTDKALPLPVLVVMLLKEGCMLVLGGVLYKKIKFVMGSNLCGKAATVAFFVGIVLAFLHPLTKPVDACLLYLAMALSVLAFILYVRQAYQRIVRKKKVDER